MVQSWPVQSCKRLANKRVISSCPSAKRNSTSPPFSTVDGSKCTKWTPFSSACLRRISRISPIRATNSVKLVIVCFGCFAVSLCAPAGATCDSVCDAVCGVVCGAACDSICPSHCLSKASGEGISAKWASRINAISAAATGLCAANVSAWPFNKVCHARDNMRMERVCATSRPCLRWASATVISSAALGTYFSRVSQ